MLEAVCPAILNAVTVSETCQAVEALLFLLDWGSDAMYFGFTMEVIVPTQLIHGLCKSAF